MPIYAYKCDACGHRQDVLQKISDPLLTVCPACGAAAFSKQLTAAGFQLKGSGWYATDFKNGGTPAKPDAAKPEGDGGAKPADSSTADKSAAPAAAQAAGTEAAKPATAAAPPAAPPAAGA
jgi:putative FmdB family regulatory protein